MTVANRAFAATLGAPIRLCSGIIPTGIVAIMELVVLVEYVVLETHGERRPPPPE